MRSCGIIQVLHTWNQEIDYHVHMHCIISGAGLTKDRKIRKSKSNFFIPVNVLRDKFKGKYMDGLSSLYEKDWCPYIKETFNGFGNAIEYLGRYTHKIAISNNRILAVTEDEVTFSARGKKLIFKLQNSRRFKQRYAGMSMAELLKAVWNFDICLCPKCGHPAMKQLGRCHVPPS